MAKPLTEVLPRIKMLPREDRESALMEYFNSEISPQLAQEDRDAAWGELKSAFDQGPERIVPQRKKSGIGETVLVGAGQGFEDVFGKLLQKIGPPERKAEQEFLREQYEAVSRDRPVIAGLSRFATSFGADPTSRIPVAKGANWLSKFFKRAGQGALESGASELIRSGGETEDLPTAMTIGGGASGATSLIGSALKGLSRAILPDASESALRGKIAQESGIKPTLGDVLPEESGVRRVEQYAEDIPFSGIKKFRKEQGKSLGKRAEEIEKKYAGRGDVTAGIKSAEKAVKEQESALYDAVEEIENKVYAGKGPKAPPRPYVNAENTRSFAEGILEEESKPGVALQSKELGTLAKKFKDLTRMTFSEARENRKRLLSEIRSMEKRAIGGNVPDWEVSQAKKLLANLDDDMKAYAKNTPLWEQFRKAQDFSRETRLPFKNPQIRKAMTEGVESSAMANKIFSLAATKPEQGAKLWKALPEMQKAQVKGQLVSDIFEKAGKITPTEEGATKFGTMATEIESLAKKNKGIFDQSEMEELTGLVKAIRAFPRATKYLEFPPTGRMMIPIMGAGGIAGTSAGLGYLSGADPITSAAMGLGGAAAISRIFTNAAARKSLIALARINEKDPLAPKLAANVFNALGKGAETTGGKILPKIYPMTKERRAE